MSKLPIVAIVGRANVGKSSLFNAMRGERQAIVADEPGTTRDSVWGRLNYDNQGHAALLVDTAGLKKAADDFELTIQDQIREAADAADHILVVVDGTTQITDEDRQVAKLSHKSGKPITLVVNKADRKDSNTPDAFVRLGIKDIFSVSASQRAGISELIAHMTADIPKRKGSDDDGVTRIALIGRPNAGKSSLFNSLAAKQQALVANQAGTTRDTNSVTLNWHQKPFEFIDTAGIRRPGSIERGVEHFSVLRAIAAIEAADICMLIMDVNEHSTHLDQRIAGMVKEAGKGLILTVSKWDSIDKDTYTQVGISRAIQREFQFVAWAPLLFTSSETGKNVSQIYELATEIMKARRFELSTTEANRWLRKITDHHPPAGLKNTRPRLKYMTQSDQNPPTFKVFGRELKLLHWSYKRYMEREFRDDFGLHGTPVHFYFIESDGRKELEAEDGSSEKPARSSKNSKPRGKSARNGKRSPRK